MKVLPKNSFDRALLGASLNALRDVIRVARDGFVAQQRELEGRLDNKSCNTAPEYLECLTDELHRVQTLLPRTMWSSQLVCVMSIAEHELNEICDSISKQLNIPSHREVKRAPLERAQAYIRKHCNVDFGRQEWERLRAIADLRNFFVHAGGEVDLSDAGQWRKVEAVRRLFPVTPLHVLDHNGNPIDCPLGESNPSVGMLVVDDSFVEAACDAAERALRWLADCEFQP